MADETIKEMYTFVVFITFAWSLGETFILGNSQCNVVPAPCTCGSNMEYIKCDSKSLLTIPNIYPFPRSVGFLQLFFNDNEIVSISSNAFRNVSTANSTNIQLYLQNNRMTSIPDTAFEGIEHSITYLNLESNYLTSLPVAIGDLVNLQVLYVHGNPLTTFGVRVLARIHRLREFHVSLGRMTSWPYEVYLLSNLHTLYVDQVNIQSLPEDAFDGFERTLSTLSLTSTRLEKIPQSICRLKRLQMFIFSSNLVLNGTVSLNLLCHDPLTELTMLRLENDNILQFPEGLFNIFPNLTHMDLIFNKLRYISYEHIPINNSLEYLHLDANSFNRIPSGIYRFRKLKYLSLYGNNIQTIGDFDLMGLLHLIRLDIQSNPLEHIDPAAFRNQQTTMRQINLDATHLDTIPNAVTSLHSLEILYFDTSPRIECSCHNLNHLQSSWNLSNITIYGSCKTTSQSIKLYIMSSLPQCVVK